MDEGGKEKFIGMGGALSWSFYKKKEKKKKALS